MPGLPRVLHTPMVPIQIWRALAIVLFPGFFPHFVQLLVKFYFTEGFHFSPHFSCAYTSFPCGKFCLKGNGDLKLLTCPAWAGVSAEEQFQPLQFSSHTEHISCSQLQISRILVLTVAQGAHKLLRLATLPVWFLGLLQRCCHRETFPSLRGINLIFIWVSTYVVHKMKDSYKSCTCCASSPVPGEASPSSQWG